MQLERVNEDLEFELVQSLHPVKISADSINKLRRRLFEKRDVIIYRRRNFELYILGICFLTLMVLILRRFLR